MSNFEKTSDCKNKQKYHIQSGKETDLKKTLEFEPPFIVRSFSSFAVSNYGYPDRVSLLPGYFLFRMVIFSATLSYFKKPIYELLKNTIYELFYLFLDRKHII